MKKMLAIAVLMIAVSFSAIAGTTPPPAPAGKYVFKRIPSTIRFLVRYGNYIGHASEGVWWPASNATVLNQRTGVFVQAGANAEGIISVSVGDLLRSSYVTGPGAFWAGSFNVSAQDIANGFIEIKLFRQN